MMTIVCTHCCVSGLSNVMSNRRHYCHNRIRHLNTVVQAPRTEDEPSEVVQSSDFIAFSNFELDSRADDAVITPQALPFHSVGKSGTTGKTYKACGGGTVTTVGEKYVDAIDSQGKLLKLPCDVTDTIRRNLLAIKMVCAHDAGARCGPGLQHEAYIAHSPQDIDLGKGAKTHVSLRSGA